ncbi:unnamed protein product [Porites evermanni]|uniref:Receptor ligand binding region domain-containing protein n=1 Tax=Porites evermanni TaxID=104178 RepID=A0ABN8QPK5_9CNID|nr:unnamed protein product [Porites evermanni]CAH3168413.1 unnamed protein product [Porites evermanni]
MKIANDFVKSNYLNELLEGQGDNFGSKLTINMDYLTAPISAVIGTEDSSSTTLVSSLLNVAAIPTISPFATSEELSSPYFNSFFRTIPPDGQQAKAMVDIIEYYQWTYIAAVAIDHSYGRYGLRALEREAYDRKTFCIAFSEFLKEATVQGLEGRTFLISEAIAFISPDVLEKNAVILKGAIGIRPYLFTDNLFEDYLRGITLNKTRESANPWWK